MFGSSEDVSGSLDERAMLAECPTNVDNERHLVGVIRRRIGNVEESRIERLDAFDDGTEKRENMERLIGQRKLLAVWRPRRGTIRFGQQLSGCEPVGTVFIGQRFHGALGIA